MRRLGPSRSRKELIMRTPKTFKVLWYSRHHPLKSQLAALAMLPGYVDGDAIELVLFKDQKASVEEVVRMLNDGKFDDLVTIVPRTVMEKLSEFGWAPLYPECTLGTETDHEFKYHGKYLKFKWFRRVAAVKLVLEPPVLGRPKKSAYLTYKEGSDETPSVGSLLLRPFRKAVV